MLAAALTWWVMVGIGWARIMLRLNTGRLVTMKPLPTTEKDLQDYLNRFGVQRDAVVFSEATTKEINKLPSSLKILAGPKTKTPPLTEEEKKLEEKRKRREAAREIRKMEKEVKQIEREIVRSLRRGLVIPR